MKQTFATMVQHKMVDPSKVDIKQTYTTQFVQGLKVMP
jgi:NitT/TauT family transport system substrate-binding protein